MKSKNKQAKGITLIALITTVVLLLITTGVAISNLTGDNRIIETNRKSKGPNRKSIILRKSKISSNTK